jgi:hypothetical protein
VLDEAYEREVTRSTSKLERQYARAEKRFRQAEARLQRAKQETRQKVKRHVIAELQLAVEARREELEEFRRMMVNVPASANHRGKDSFRPVPVTRGIQG